MNLHLPYWKMTMLCFIAIFSLEGRIVAQHDYALAQHLSTYFLGAQRSGNTDSWIHGNSHLQDGEAVGKDLSGGWYDCGDYIKFHFTEAHAAYMYIMAYEKFPEAYADNYSSAFSAPPSNGIPDILDEVKIETDYLLKCIDGNTAYWQVGAGDDHNTFNEPVSASSQELYNGSSVRPVFSTTSGYSNSMGSAAAALAAMSIVYAPFDQGYANACKDAAEDYYAIGKINPTSKGDPDGFYSFLENAEWRDEMGLAAAVLHRATGQQSYLTDAQNYANNLSQWGSFGYSSVDHLVFLELYDITNNTTWLDKVAWKVNSYSNASCGYVHITNWGSLRDAGYSALLALLYHRETMDQDAYDFAKSNIDFILGSHGYISQDAPANFSFLIGYDELNGGYPQHPHHAAAFGKSSNAWSLFSAESANPGSVNFEHELTGGLAGGPESECANFEDNVGNYVSSEYCVYYNAGFTGAVAYINKVENSIVSSLPIVQTQNQIIEHASVVTDHLSVKIPKSSQVTLVDQYSRIVATGQGQEFDINTSHLSPGKYQIICNEIGYAGSFVKI